MKRMRHFKGSKHTLTSPTYFRGSRPPAPGPTPLDAHSGTRHTLSYLPRVQEKLFLETSKN